VFQIRLQQQAAASVAALRSRLQVWAEERGWSLAGSHESEEILYIQGVTSPSELEPLASWEGVEVVCAENAPATAAIDRLPHVVEVGAAKFGGKHASFIAGPCSVEDFDSLLALAEQLAAAGATALRGGAFKPRTSPYAFQGLGKPGLEILAAVRGATGLPIVTEVLDLGDLETVAGFADVLQVGSRNMSNSSLLKEVGRVGKPVLLKRGMSATLEEFLYAAEYVALGDAPAVLLCERGLRHFDPAVRNLLDLSAVPALKARTGLPVLVDPSHGTGRADLVPDMLLASAAAGADGFLVEVHSNPEAAWSDAHQALPLATFGDVLPRVARVLAACGRELCAARVTRTQV
jgi:3-deoxy-7-phosphoheptulonate synthase